MDDRTCEFCGESLRGKSPAARYCSQAHKERDRKRRRASGIPPEPLRPSPKRRSATRTPRIVECSWCSAAFEAKLKRARYCSDACRERGKWAEAPKKPCVTCGAPTGYRATDEIASAECAVCRGVGACGTASGYRNGCRCEGCRTAGKSERDTLKRKWIDEGRIEPPKLQGVTCLDCGVPLRSLGQRCRPCGAKYRGSGSWISSAVRMAIYERDGWMCQLCGGAVRTDLPYTHALYPSLDHIVCRSWTETPDHSPSNLRLAHRGCNSSRRDREEWTPPRVLSA